MTRWTQRLGLAAILITSVLGASLSLGAGAQDAEPQGQDQAGAALENAASIKSVEVFFATNRQREKQEGAGVLFGGRRGEPTFGTCLAEFRSIPGLGGIAERIPFYVPSETSDLRIELQSDREAFWAEFREAVASTQSRDVVVFIHGYSYDFARSCERAAEAQRTLDGQATILLFTWPSNGDATDYVSDQTDLEWSVPFLRGVLERLTEEVGAGRVHVLAHSMGSRGVIQALESWRAEQGRSPFIGRLALLAPDFDSQVFLGLLPGLIPLAESITVYVSDRDTPLKFSHQLNGSPRLGQAGEYLTVVEGMETIDVTPAGRYQYLGHEYFYFHPQVGADLFELVTTGRSAGERSRLRARQLGELTYWEVIPARDR